MPNGITERDSQSCIITDLLGISRNAFLEHYFEIRPLIETTKRNSLARKLCSIDRPEYFAMALQNLCQRRKGIRLLKNGVVLEIPRLKDGSVDITSLWTQFHDGATIVLHKVETIDAVTKDVCDELTCSVGHEVWVNAYLTPPNAVGLPVHYDPHDVIVYQLLGEKKWQLFEKPNEVPRFPSDRTLKEVKHEILERRPAELFHLTPGAAAYIPRGTPHRVENLGNEASLHITIGMTPIEVADVMKLVIDAVRIVQPEIGRCFSADTFIHTASCHQLAQTFYEIGEQIAGGMLNETITKVLRKNLIEKTRLLRTAPFSIQSFPNHRLEWRAEVYSKLSPNGDAWILSNGDQSVRLSSSESQLLMRFRENGSMTSEQLSQLGGESHSTIAKASSLGLVRYLT